MFKYVFRTLTRHRARSLLTILGSSVAIFVFCIVGSVQEGLNQLTIGADAERSLIVFQENRFCPATSRLPEDYASKILKIPGVKDVMPIQVWTNNCRASLDVVVFLGANPKKMQVMRPIRLIRGSWSQLESQHDDLVDLIGFAHWLGYACVALVLSLVATTTIMSVQDRMKEYAVLQTIGVRPIRTMRLVLAESTVLCLLGGVAGSFVALLVLYFGRFAIGAEGATISFQPSWHLVLSSIVTSLIVGVAAGLLPAFQTARMSIVHELKSA